MLYQPEERLWNFELLKPGDIIGTIGVWFGINHFALMDEGCKVIHNRPNHNWKITDDGVSKEDFCFFIEGEKKRVKGYTFRKFSGTQEELSNILGFANKMVGQMGFSYIFNNCEHFINFVTTGKFESSQVKKYSLNVLSGVNYGS